MSRDRTLGASDYTANAFAVVRERQAKYGSVAIPKLCSCQICTPKKQSPNLPPPGIPSHLMALIPTTGVVKYVQDCVCIKCAKEHAATLNRHARIVCVGCREVVAQVEPFVEKSGFTWKAGGFYHVLECPTCTGRITMTKSDIAEKIWFYKQKGIPYE